MYFLINAFFFIGKLYVYMIYTNVLMLNAIKNLLTMNS